MCSVTPTWRSFLRSAEDDVDTSDTNTPPASTASLLVWEPIDTPRLLESVAHDAAGANVLFTGTTRGVTAGVLATPITKRLTYEAHEPLASAVLDALVTLTSSKLFTAVNDTAPAAPVLGALLVGDILMFHP